MNIYHSRVLIVDRCSCSQEVPSHTMCSSLHLRITDKTSGTHIKIISQIYDRNRWFSHFGHWRLGLKCETDCQRSHTDKRNSYYYGTNFNSATRCRSNREDDSQQFFTKNSGRPRQAQYHAMSTATCSSDPSAE
jgi:hypothetical protein